MFFFFYYFYLNLHKLPIKYYCARINIISDNSNKSMAQVEEVKVNDVEDEMKELKISINYDKLSYKEAIEMGESIGKDDRSSVQYYNYESRDKHKKFIGALPENLQIKRKDWTKHKAFDSQTLLIRGHRNFRQSSKRCVELIVSVLKSNKNNKKSLQSIRTVQNIYYSLMSSLHSHSRYEENKLFKYLEKKYNVDLSLLLEDHQLIETMEETCKSSLNHIISSKSASKELVLKALRHFIKFDNNFVRHLGEEESIVIPMLLELTYKEYVKYYNARTYKQALGI